MIPRWDWHVVRDWLHEIKCARLSIPLDILRCLWEDRGMTNTQLAKLTKLMPFDHHTDAVTWVNTYAEGPVCVIDTWTYGAMVCWHEPRTYRELREKWITKVFAGLVWQSGTPDYEPSEAIRAGRRDGSWKRAYAANLL